MSELSELLSGSARALVVGMGVTNRAVAGALLRRGHSVVAVDDRPDDTLRRATADLGIELVETPDAAQLAVLAEETDIVLPAPGLPESHPAFALGRPVASELDLAAVWDDRPIAAIDLSGMGESGRRDNYNNTLRLAEMAAVIADAGLGAKPVVVGHSFGGNMTTCFGHHHGADLSGVVIVDSFVRPPSDNDGGSGGPGRPKPYFPNKETIVRRYRLSPYQPCENEFIVDFIAQNSVVEEERGWTWKYDDNVRGRGTRDEPLADYLRDMACPKALFYGDESVFLTDGALEFTKEQYGDGDRVIEIPAAGHHLMLDQPIAFVVGLRTVLAGWGV